MARWKHKTLSDSAQAAAVREELKSRGVTLESLKADHPELAQGISIVEAEMAKPPRRRGSGSSRPVASRLPVPPR